MAIKIDNIRTELQRFNSEPLLCGIREKYNTPSFFEMIDKTRSETSHSAFLRWMLCGQGISETTADSPLFLFLNLLAKRSMEQESKFVLMNNEIRDSILSRKIKLSIKEIVTERMVRELAELAFDSFDELKQKVHRKYLSEIIASVTDRVDIVVDCDIENCGSFNHLILIIENKVDSDEGEKKSTQDNKNIPSVYKNLTQTNRYYYATHHNASSETAIVYVFLTSKLLTDELKTFSKNRDDLKKEKKCSLSNHYININYQDILNDVIDKLLLLGDGSITLRTRMFLSEYKNEITFPHIENPKSHVNIAHPSIEGIESLWKDYRFLFHCIAYSCVSNKGVIAIWNADELFFCDTYAQRIQDLSQLPESIRAYLPNPSQKTMVLRKFEKIFNTIIEYTLICRDSFEDGIDQILYDYANENLDILITIISDVVYVSSKYSTEAAALRELLLNNTRDNTKYMVKYKNQPLAPKHVSKSEVAFLIFREWQKENNAQIEQMRKAFPVSINSYYSSRKYFKELFYPYSTTGYYYDGEDQRFASTVKITDNWDVYKDSDHNYNGITNLKMWRKDAFDSLLKHLSKNHSNFFKHLEIKDSDGNIIE